ncbi:ABC transporter ATP-binding protein [Brevundimonas sp.]|uniref:ABC transporter ATP-binding protein n=1 Tax=Brevundimonas sp. TaxID=1871086 RepID=UPI00351D567F
MAETPTVVAAALEDVVVAWPGRPPIGPFDLAVAPGEIVALVGASGAGKSTVLRLLAGLEQPSRGLVARGARPGRTGFVFQAPTLMNWADTLANVALPLELSGVARPEARRRAGEALAAVGLGDRLTARPRQLSGGMAMRASLARALVTEPDLLLLDEPFAALDSVTRRRLIEDLHRLWAARTPRPAIVFVTHDVEEAVYLAGRALVLDAATGRVAAELASPGPLPRTEGWRKDARYRTAVESLAVKLARSMAPFPVEGGRAGDGGDGRPTGSVLGAADTAPVAASSTPVPTLPPSTRKGS